MYNNSFNPYLYNSYMPSNVGLFSKLKGIGFGNILTNTSKTLGVINQAIPIYYQVKPLWNNARTMLRIRDELRDSDDEVVETNSNSNSNSLFYI